jgi:hypothetical protein
MKIALAKMSAMIRELAGMSALDGPAAGVSDMVIELTAAVTLVDRNRRTTTRHRRR